MLSPALRSGLVGDGEFVGLRCAAETLRAVATRLTRFGPAEGGPDWLVSAVWLCTDDDEFLATASAMVLANGHVARPLNLHRPGELMREVKADLPNVLARLVGRNGDLDAEVNEEVPAPPSSLADWAAGSYTTKVLIRVSERHETRNRIACGLLFERDGRSLLVGTDPSTLAMVLSEDALLIERYRVECEAWSPNEYLSRARD